jgi:aminopeptidase
MAYKPPQEILDKYAQVLVNFALGGGAGIKKGDRVYLQGALSALPLFRAVKRRILLSGGHTIASLGDDMDGFGRYFYEHASDEQLTSFPAAYYKGLVQVVDHRVALLSDYDVHEMDKVDPKKMMLSQKSSKKAAEWFEKKENAGKYTWTLALYGTPSMAKEAGLSLEEYWEQIIDACYLDRPDPIAEWRKISSEVERVAKKLTELKIDRLHVTGTDIDLAMTIGQKRKWLGGSGRNIPSFEVFTSPDWRGTNGWVRFNQPLYYYGPKVEDIRLEFKNGRVANASAGKNENLLKEMLATDRGASQMGEYSLTDKRLSRITKFMAETLFDENMGGPYGNTHLAVGRSYHDTFDGDTSKMNKKLSRELGYNESAIHVDMISTTDRTATATLSNGKKQVIYRNGQFTV